jgi:hypothetical protein
VRKIHSVVLFCVTAIFPFGCQAQSTDQAKSQVANDFFIENSLVIHSWDGENAGDQFGWTARKTGDLDNDGINDFVATAPSFKNSSGKIYAYSSRSGKLLFTKTGQAGQLLGNSARSAGDIDGDSIDDIIAGAPGPKQIGRALVYSGKSGELLRTFKGSEVGDQFGYDVCTLGDLDGDGTADVAVSSINGNGKEANAGCVRAFSGKSGKTLFELQGESTGDQFGSAICASVQKDRTVLAVGAPNSGTGDRGGVYIYQLSNVSAKLLFKINNEPKDVALGQMFVSFPGDLNNDGTPDVYVSDFQSHQGKPAAGRVAVHSGTDGERLLSILGEQAGEGLGTSPSNAGDVDGDGIGDLVIGAWQNRDGAKAGGRIYLYSSKTGRLLRTWTAKQEGGALGFDSVGIGDVNGDGHADFLITAAWANGQGAKTGRVFIVAGEDYQAKKD